MFNEYREILALAIKAQYGVRLSFECPKHASLARTQLYYFRERIQRLEDVMLTIS